MVGNHWTCETGAARQMFTPRTSSMADPNTIYHWYQLNDRITTFGQPAEEQLADIQALGVHHVINLGLHTHEKALPDEAASIAHQASASAAPRPAG
jgi:hypothetical protein